MPRDAAYPRRFLPQRGQPARRGTFHPPLRPRTGGARPWWLLFAWEGSTVAGMSSVEVKASVAEMSVEERLEFAALIAPLNRAADPEYQSELDRRMAAMDSGRQTAQADLERSHQELSAQGR